MNPILLEESFQSLLRSLKYCASRRNRLLLICEFFESLQAAEDPAAISAYAPELLQELISILPGIRPECTPPWLFERASAMVVISSSHNRRCLEPEEWDKVQRTLASLRHQAAGFASERGEDGVLTPTEREEDRPGFICVPMVETEPVFSGLESIFGCLCRFEVEMAPRYSDSGEVNLFIDQVADPDGKQHQTIRKALVASGHLFQKLTGVAFSGGYNIHCRFDIPNIVYGDSIGLAAAAILLCELLRVSGNRNQASINHHAAFTGSISEDGQVLPVDSFGLQKKLEACFYSPISFVVLPKSQLEDARSIVRQLVDQTPRAIPPTLVGVEGLAEVFYDRRLTIIRKIPGYKTAARRIWKLRRPIAGTLIVVLTAVLLSEMLGPFDKNPVTTEFRDHWLLVKNQYGTKLAQYEVGSDIAEDAVSREHSGFPIGGVCLYDVNGDGENEVLYRTRRDKDMGSERIVCASVSKNRVIWEKQIRKKLFFPGKPEIQSEAFSLPVFIVGDFERNNTPTVILLANHTFFPSLIVKLDARSGNELDSYLHIGQLADLRIADFDSTVCPKIVACGVNNAFKKGIVVVLDPRKLSGCSPTRGDYVPEPYVRASEDHYILIPRTVAAEAMGELTANNGVNAIRIDRVQRVIEARDVDFRVDLPKFGLSAPAELLMYFDQEMHPLRVGTTTDFDLTVRRIVQLGWLRAVPDKTYFDDFLKRVEYWNGIQFVPFGE